MPRIISVISLILCFALHAEHGWTQAQPAAGAQEEPMPGTVPGAEATPAAVPEQVTTEPASPAASQVPPSDSGPVLRDETPNRYVVVKGDTLWDISARFLKNPWKWPDLWGVNRDVVKNPHWIYPGDVLILDLTGATPRLRLEGAPDGGLSRWYGYELQESRLRPRMRSEPLGMAIPTIPAKAIEPFLVRPLVVNPGQIAGAPKIVQTIDKRVIVSAGDLAYVVGLEKKKGPRWQVYRPGRVFQDPDTQEVLGFEAVYLGDADVTGFGRISTVQIATAIQEIGKGDRLTVAPPLQSAPYVPRAPDRPVTGRVIAGSDNTVSEMGTFSVVILNRGARDGLEVGHVLGLFRSEGMLPVSATETLPLPEQRYGLVMVFRVFERLSYGLVMSSSRPVNVLDTVHNP